MKAKTENSRSKSYRFLFQQFPCIPDLEMKNSPVDPNLVICETETEYQTAAGLKTSQIWNFKAPFKVFQSVVCLRRTYWTVFFVFGSLIWTFCFCCVTLRGAATSGTRGFSLSFAPAGFEFSLLSGEFIFWAVVIGPGRFRFGLFGSRLNGFLSTGDTVLLIGSILTLSVD